MNLESNTNECDIRHAGLNRNGKDRWWCRTHGANATGKHGVRLEKCVNASFDVTKLKRLELDIDLYEGGIGIWGAVEPVFNTTSKTQCTGVHVHARKSSAVDKKDIDGTFDVVTIPDKADLFNNQPIAITKNAAIAFYISTYLNRDLKYLICPHCRSVHLDEAEFVLTPHVKHLCTSCGRYFDDTVRGVSNPVEYFRTLSSHFLTERKFIDPERELNIRQECYPGGIEIWASNPALIWTRTKPEEKGIHVHAYDGENLKPCIDDTYSSVRIDDVYLEVEQIACLMAQQTLVSIKSKLCVIDCPACKKSHFDKNYFAFEAHKKHVCEHCKEAFSVKKPVVSNPVVRKLEFLSNKKPDNAK
ncbi:MAG: hypothetical protein RIM72_14200 [Alphaproteobacteria bacterium]